MSEPFQWQELLDVVGLNQQQQREAAPRIDRFGGGKRISFLGTPGAGKTVTVGGLVMRAEAKVADTAHSDTPFFCRVLENASEIHQDVSDLRDGHFPKKTQTYLGFRSSPGLMLEWKRMIGVGRIKRSLWHKMLQVPICDLPGETLIQVIRHVRSQSNLGMIMKKNITNAINDMRESDGYMIAIKASRAKGLGVQLEQEKDDKLSRDPDVNLVRMLEDLMHYKSTYTNRPIKGVAVIITAWDRLQPVAERVGFDILDPNVGQRDIERFVRACFPSTYAAIRSLRVPNVRYFPTFFQVETNDKGQEKWITEGGYDGPKIITKDLFDPKGEWWQNARKISYSEQSFDNLLGWLKDFAINR
jgi:hypothetical protein